MFLYHTSNNKNRKYTISHFLFIRYIHKNQIVLMDTNNVPNNIESLLNNSHNAINSIALTEESTTRLRDFSIMRKETNISSSDYNSSINSLIQPILMDSGGIDSLIDYQMSVFDKTLPQLLVPELMINDSIFLLRQGVILPRLTGDKNQTIPSPSPFLRECLELNLLCKSKDSLRDDIINLLVTIKNNETSTVPENTIENLKSDITHFNTVISESMTNIKNTNYTPVQIGDIDSRLSHLENVHKSFEKIVNNIGPITKFLMEQNQFDLLIGATTLIYPIFAYSQLCSLWMSLYITPYEVSGRPAFSQNLIDKITQEKRREFIRFNQLIIPLAAVYFGFICYYKSLNSEPKTSIKPLKDSMLNITAISVRNSINNNKPIKSNMTTTNKVENIHFNETNTLKFRIKIILGICVYMLMMHLFFKYFNVYFPSAYEFIAYYAQNYTLIPIYLCIIYCVLYIIYIIIELIIIIAYLIDKDFYEYKKPKSLPKFINKWLLGLENRCDLKIIIVHIYLQTLFKFFIVLGLIILFLYLYKLIYIH